MIARRAVLAGMAASATMVSVKAAAAGRLSISGSTEQGGLMVGKAAPGAVVDLDGVALTVSPSGIFCFGIPYDAAKPLRVTARFADGFEELREITPIVRQYDIQAINGLDEKYVAPPQEILDRIAREHALITEARKRVTEGLEFALPIEWPCAGRLSGIYGSQRILNGKPMAPHLGVDVAAPEGTPIHAAADAIVAITDEFHLEGGFTLLDHGLGVNTCYLHQSKRLVTAGQRVKRGEVIGLIGHTGRATGPHTHWGLNWFEVKLDPSRATATPTPPQG
ncbi:murein DD-endopeptidase MepM/ murein hydrolase activator NlpD [Rhizomicrobium palustre]|uniref:Murein DD-endopeptidase MepM/ murein hydrolase activator NlpD n=1 Tax=Rhizomicrobium palustre TaxID=189966 RepID=A0A846N263_9PROT|nr:M23 family metallopeptidase [Rhizomicrobium palustre]NIK89312.1 murein DD-endopeptidase MepM/ murein hydrolase activator NlpD [Rhizomicrobium palustre]